jgi:hypothetical protein
MITYGQGLVCFIEDEHFLITTSPFFKGMKQGWGFESVEEVEKKLEEIQAALVHYKLTSGITANKEDL